MNLFYILNGLGVTIFVTIWSWLTGFVMGLYMAKIRFFKNNYLKKFFHMVSIFFRSTPLIFQILFFAYCIPMIFHLNISSLIIACMVFSINSASYFSEIFITSFLALPENQYKLANILNFSEKEAIKKLFLPQILQNSENLISNELNNLLKESSILSFVGLNDLMFYAREFSALTYDFFKPIIFVGVIYLILSLIFEKFLNRYLMRIIYVLVDIFF